MFSLRSGSGDMEKFSKYTGPSLIELLTLKSSILKSLKTCFSL